MPVYPLKGIPGTFEAVIEVYQEGDTQIADRPHTGFTLAALREFYGGDEGSWQSPITGATYRVSLKPYLSTDTPSTRYIISGRFTPRRPFAPEHLTQIEAYVKMTHDELANLGSDSDRVHP